jgi:hypothetical protein
MEKQPCNNVMQEMLDVGNGCPKISKNQTKQKEVTNEILGYSEMNMYTMTMIS